MHISVYMHIYIHSETSLTSFCLKVFLLKIFFYGRNFINTSITSNFVIYEVLILNIFPLNWFYFSKTFKTGSSIYPDFLKYYIWLGHCGEKSI